MKRHRDSQTHGRSTRNNRRSVPEEMPAFIFIQHLEVLYTLGFGLERTHCPEPSPPQDDRLASFPFSPSILTNESRPFTAWAEFTETSPLPQNVSISIELVDNEGNQIQDGLSTSSSPVSVVGARFEGRSARTEKFGINKTSCDVYGGCEIKDFKDHNHALLHFRFTIIIDNEAYPYYTPGDWVLSKMPSGDRLQYFIDAQRDLPRSTCHFQTACGRRHPQHQDNNIELRYTIRVFYPAFDIQNWGLADLYQHIARCMGRVIPEAQGHHEIGGGQQIFAVYDVQEPQEAENQDVIDQMPLDIDPEVVNPAEPANAIHNADWQLQQDFGNGEDDDIDPFMVYMDNLEQLSPTPFYYDGLAPPNILPTPEHPHHSQQERADALIHSPDIYNPRQEIQEFEDQDVIAQMPLDIDSEGDDPVEPANAIHKTEWQLKEQGVDNAEDYGIDALTSRGNIHDWPWQTSIYYDGDAPLDLLQATPEHPPRAQDANQIAELMMMTIDENATEDNEEDDVDGKGDDHFHFD
eukprot:TRINITY_DN148_c0_g1_i4.p1 TRINITY_DN148_c0_g1~~TRINITY_DN148_c0_g1_i4.p1  ORF type:complete len:521 (-),score=87.26 TRINITY_DN148_c0_g1_i4:232-1794(-)